MRYTHGPAGRQRICLDDSTQSYVHDNREEYGRDHVTAKDGSNGVNATSRLSDARSAAAEVIR